MQIARSTQSFVVLAAFAATALAQQAPSAAKPAFDVQVKTIAPVKVVVLPMKGSYMQHPDAFSRLATYLSGKRVTPAGPAFGRYYSDPSVGEANLVWEVGFPVPAGVAVEAPFEAKELPATQYAVHLHRGAMEELGSTWATLFEWSMTNGYKTALPAMQVFNGDMGTAEVEMRLPVTK